MLAAFADRRGAITCDMCPLPGDGPRTFRIDDQKGLGLMQPWEYRARWYGEDEETARGNVAGADGPS